MASDDSSSEPTELELASTADLLLELSRRMTAIGVILYAGRDDTDAQVQVYTKGERFLLAGLTQSLADYVASHTVIQS